MTRRELLVGGATTFAAMPHCVAASDATGAYLPLIGSAPVQENPASPKLCVRIPLADGNPDSRVYAYEVVVAGEGVKLRKAVYATGVNMGIGHEPNGGVTTLEISKSELPPCKTLTIAARPLTSLGTSGRPIITDFKV
jgi:hypothetical protein